MDSTVPSASKELMKGYQNLLYFLDSIAVIYFVESFWKCPCFKWCCHQSRVLLTVSFEIKDEPASFLCFSGLTHYDSWQMLGSMGLSALCRGALEPQIYTIFKTDHCWKLSCVILIHFTSSGSISLRKIIILSSLLCVFQVLSSTQDLQTKFCMHFECLPYRLHVLPMLSLLFCIVTSIIY
jgi:hypothetical protein